MSRSTSHVYEPAAPPPSEPREPARLGDPPPLVFDRAGVRAVDREAVERYGIPGIVLMENASRGLLEVAKSILQHTDPTGVTLIICGGGNNGGDGYALARHLHNRGVEVALVPVGLPRPDTDAATNFEICQRLNLRQIAVDKLEQFATQRHIALIVDAIFGTGLERPVGGIERDVIEWINSRHAPVLAVDVPSGMDCDTGRPLGAAVRASHTVTLVGLKKGMIGLDAQKLLGEVTVADIGAPRELLEQYGRVMEVPHPEVPDHDPPPGWDA